MVPFSSDLQYHLFLHPHRPVQKLPPVDTRSHDTCRAVLVPLPFIVEFSQLLDLSHCTYISQAVKLYVPRPVGIQMRTKQKHTLVIMQYLIFFTAIVEGIF
jgi:hypothetical protein